MSYVNIGSDSDLSPIRHQAIIYTNVYLWSIGPLAINVNKFLSKLKKII